MSVKALKIGSKVRFVDEIGGGIVTEILSEELVMVEDDSGFENAHPTQNLIVIENTEAEMQAYERAVPTVLEILQQEADPQKTKRLEKDFNQKYAEVASKGHQDSMEIDLHMHAIVDSQSGLSPSVMLELQLAHFERMLQIGIRQRTKKMVFIHGIGQGVLRHQIWSRVEQYYPDCSCRSADPRKYGSGATEIWVGESAFRTN